MTLTVRQMIQEAIEQSRVLGSGAEPENEEVTTALVSYNLLITSSTMGGWAQIGDVEDPDDQFPLPDDLRDYFAAMLAVRLCTKFSKPVPEGVAKTAVEGENFIMGSRIRGVEMEIDAGLLNMPSQRI
jgi:hypothetical protein